MYINKNKYALFRITDSERKNLERLVFQRHPTREWGTFFRFGYRRTSWGASISFVDAVAPGAGDLDRSSGIVSFRPRYISRALDVLANGPLGAGFIHSHPRGQGAYPSPSDDDMDEYFADLFKPYGNSRPYCSLIINQDDDGTLAISGRVYDCEWIPVRALMCPAFPYLRVTDESVHFRATPEVDDKPQATAAGSVTARLDQLFGTFAAKTLSDSTVGVVGCSGTGSPAVECLARARVGRLVIVDPKLFSPPKLERMHGSVFSDTMTDPPLEKVRIMRRMILEINPAAEITAIRGNILDDMVTNELLRCDVILGCTDTHHGRAALSDLAARFLVPSIDVGVLLDGGKGKVTAQLVEVTKYAPGLPCAFCSRCVETWPIAVECMSAEERTQRKEAAALAKARGEDGLAYWGGEPPELPTVGYLTTTAGALTAGYAINFLAGTGDMPHSRLQFDVGSRHFGFVDVNREFRLSCSCRSVIGHGDQANPSISRPHHWPPPQRFQE
jgi:hypothetical protein